MSKLGYPDLKNGNEVYKAILGYGMFSEKLPPCFSAEKLLDLKAPTKKYKRGSHVAINFSSSRHTGTSRQIGIPHPQSYFHLCRVIKSNWKHINEHIGKPKTKFNFCHVRKLNDKKCIFEMSYKKGVNKITDSIEARYYIGCTHVVNADISTCFPSIYTHAIPWAIRGKDDSKKDRKHWSDKLDKATRDCNDKQTNGILIGPHASNIISEIILTRIDCALQARGHKKVLRHIDDYTYFADNETDAMNFLKNLELALKDHELLLNDKKTKITTLAEYFSDSWNNKLLRFNFARKGELGYKTISAYLDYAISLSKTDNDLAAITYAIKVIAGENLENKTKNLYVQKILSLSIIYPYLLPLLEDFVLILITDSLVTTKVLSLEEAFKETPEDKEQEVTIPFEEISTCPFDCSIFTEFLIQLFNSAISNNQADALAFAFYFALK